MAVHVHEQFVEFLRTLSAEQRAVLGDKRAIELIARRLETVGRDFTRTLVFDSETRSRLVRKGKYDQVDSDVYRFPADETTKSRKVSFQVLRGEDLVDGMNVCRPDVLAVEGVRLASAVELLLGMSANRNFGRGRPLIGFVQGTDYAFVLSLNATGERVLGACHLSSRWLGEYFRRLKSIQPDDYAFNKDCDFLVVKS